MDPECKTMNVEEAAKILGIGRNGAYQAVRSGQIPVIRIGGRILVPRAALEVMLSDAAPVPECGAERPNVNAVSAFTPQPLYGCRKEQSMEAQTTRNYRKETL